jgi:hypothetical protein
MLNLIKTREILIPRIAIQLRQNSFHMRCFKRVKRRMRHLPHIVSLDHESQQLRVCPAEGSSHFNSEGFFAAEEALDFESERI